MIRHVLLHLLLVFASLGLISGVFVWRSMTTDPYSPYANVNLPYETQIDSTGNIQLVEHFSPKLMTNPLARATALAQTGIRIPLYSLLLREQPLTGDTTAIIQQIHATRFDPSKPYVITGAHYSDLYIRNLGVFFNSLLDPRLPTTSEDWQNRQRIALQTVQYDLEFFRQAGRAVTTIVPLGGDRFTGVNIYEEPSDALFGVLYTLRALSDDSFIVTVFPSTTTIAPQPPLKTTQAASQLLDKYRPVLEKILNHYLTTALDPQTNLVRRDIHLSSARDGVKRESSFYDNVIVWGTVQLADQLQIPHSPTPPADEWKQHIITTFWDEQNGIFRDDLRGCDQLAEHCPPAVFSADSLIVTSTRFFDLKNDQDRSKLHRMLDYIRSQQLDVPFPLRYSRTNSDTPKHFTVQVFAPSYMGDGIWSHWGMEYVKALILVGDSYPDSQKIAAQHLQTYASLIEKNGGYPELYNTDGSAFSSSLLRGVLHTGWVVNYEQARMMAE